MNDIERRRIIECVPIGQVQARSARAIWLELACWAPTSVRHELDAMARAGLLVRRENPIRGGVQWVYWREAA